MTVRDRGTLVIAPVGGAAAALILNFLDNLTAHDADSLKIYELRQLLHFTVSQHR